MTCDNKNVTLSSLDFSLACNQTLTFWKDYYYLNNTSLPAVNDTEQLISTVLKQQYPCVSDSQSLSFVQNLTASESVQDHSSKRQSNTILSESWSAVTDGVAKCERAKCQDLDFPGNADIASTGVWTISLILQACANVKAGSCCVRHNSYFRSHNVYSDVGQTSLAS